MRRFFRFRRQKPLTKRQLIAACIYIVILALILLAIVTHKYNWGFSQPGTP